MTKLDLSAELKALSLRLLKDDDFVVDDAELSLEKNSAGKLKGVPSSIKDFYLGANGYVLDWTHVRFKANRFVQGHAKIQQLDDVLIDGKGLLWFDHTEADDPIRQFRILDYVSDEVFVGFYLGPRAPDMLYYYSISDTPRPLQLDMGGYVKMLSTVIAFKFWQKAVLTLIDGTLYPETATLQEYLPQVLEDFSFDTFRETFESVKI